MNSSFKTEGIILKRSNFGEADRILTVFTKHQGKIKILAKGTRKITSHRGPNIEIFNQVTLYVHRGKTFDILTEAQVINAFDHIRDRLDLVSLAYYACELVDGLCAEQQPQEKVYVMLEYMLRELDSGLVHRFEKGLLSELGFLTKTESSHINTTAYIEQLLERKLKSRRMIGKLS
jgi:DNA repair protein RecO (recombination protein O)